MRDIRKKLLELIPYLIPHILIGFALYKSR